MKDKYKVLLMILGVVFLCSIYFSNKIVEDTDWWTDVFCNMNGGELDERIGFDFCIINNSNHVALFDSSGEYDKYREIYKWQLKAVKR